MGLGSVPALRIHNPQGPGTGVGGRTFYCHSRGRRLQRSHELRPQDTPCPGDHLIALQRETKVIQQTSL